MARAFPSVVIDNLQPLIDCGRSAIKRIVGEDLVVEADIFKDVSIVDVSEAQIIEFNR